MQRFDIFDLTDEEIDNLPNDKLEYIANFYDWNVLFKNKFTNEVDYLNCIKEKAKEKKENFLKKKTLLEKNIEDVYKSKEYKECSEKCKTDKEYANKCFQEYKEGWIEIGEVCKELFKS